MVKSMQKHIHFHMCTDYLGLCYSQAEQVQMNGENCTKLCLLPILFIYNIYGGFCKANSQLLLAVLQACLTSVVSGKCVAIYSSVEMVLIT